MLGLGAGAAGYRVVARPRVYLLETCEETICGRVIRDARNIS